jgi:hypothetical protein
MIDEIFLGSFAVSWLCAYPLFCAVFIVIADQTPPFAPQNLLSFALIALLVGYHYYAAEPRARQD